MFDTPHIIIIIAIIIIHLETLGHIYSSKMCRFCDFLLKVYRTIFYQAKMIYSKQ